MIRSGQVFSKKAVGDKMQCHLRGFRHAYGAPFLRRFLLFPFLQKSLSKGESTYSHFGRCGGGLLSRHKTRCGSWSVGWILQINYKL